MATERILIIVEERGTRVVKRNIAGIGVASKTSAGSVNFLRRALIGLGGALILTSSVRTVAQFEQALSSAAVIAKATEVQFIQLRDAARDLGATTRFTATQAAEGLLFLSRAGFTVKESLEAIGPTLLLAQSGALDLGRAADIASNIMRGFRLDMDKAAISMDVLALVATSSNTNIEQLGDALKFVAPVAAGLGLTLEETAAMVGALSNAGLQASLAGTGLRRVMAELETPSKKTVKILRTFGIEVAEVRVSTVGLTEALTILRDAGVDAGKGMEIFGQRGGPAFEVLKSSIPDVIELTKALKNAEGTSLEIATAMDDNLNGALLRVKSAFEAVILSIGQFGASTLLTNFVNNLAAALRVLAANIESLRIALIGLAIAAIPRVILAIQSLTIAIVTSQFAVVLAIGKVIVGLRTLAITMALTGAGALSIIPKVILGLRALAGAIAATGIGGLALAVGIAVSALTLFRDKLLVTGDGLTTLGDLAQAVFERMKKTVTILVNAIGDLFGNQFLSDFKVTFSDLGMLFEIFVRGVARSADMLLGTWVGLRRGIEASFENLPDALLEFVNKFANGVIDIINLLLKSALAALQTIGDTFFRLIRSAQDAFALLVASIKNALAGNAAEAERLGKEAAFQMKKGITNALTDLPATLADNFEKLSDKEFIPRLKVIGDGAGKTLAADFLEGFAGGMEESTIFQDSVSDIFERAGDIGRARQLEGQRARDEAALGDAPGGLLDPDGDRKLKDTTSALAGINAGFKTLNIEIHDFASLTEAALVNTFNNAEDALVQFVQTGQIEFSTLVDSMLADLTRLLARQALVGLLGAVSGGSTGAAAATALAARAHGGPVEPGKTFLVGEEGPELFSPASRGTITPAGPTAAAMAPVAPPVVNVQVVNVTDPNEVTAALATPEGQEAILNVIRRNPRAMREIS